MKLKNYQLYVSIRKMNVLLDHINVGIQTIIVRGILLHFNIFYHKYKKNDYICIVKILYISFL